MLYIASHFFCEIKQKNVVLGLNAVVDKKYTINLKILVFLFITASISFPKLIALFEQRVMSLLSSEFLRPARCR